MFYLQSIQLVPSDPLVVGLEIAKTIFRISGVCVDALNSGYVINIP